MNKQHVVTGSRNDDDDQERKIFIYTLKITMNRENERT